MDPASVIGVTSFALQLVGQCVQGFVLLSAANDIGKVGSDLICLLNIQEARLVDWAKRAGLLDETPRLDPRLNATLINAILGQLDGLLGDVDKLSVRYNFHLVQEPANAQTTNPAVRGIVEGLVSDNTRRDILFRAKLIKSHNVLPKRLWWAGIDSDKFRELVRTIQTLIQELWNLLDPLANDDMMRKIDQILLQAIHQSRVVEQTHTLQAAITMDAAMSSPTRNESVLADVASLRATRLQVGDLSDEPEQDVEGASVVLSHNALLDFEKVTHFQGLGDDGDMGIAQYDGRECFVEFRTTPQETRARLIIMKRVKNLTRFLTVPKHPAFQVLSCMGVAIAPDHSKLYFVFRLPHTGHRPVSLLTLLGLSKGSLPSLTARIKLAERLLSAMRYIHAAGWIHRNIRSENILFFTQGGDINSFTVRGDTPPFIVGFAFARLGLNKYSEGLSVLEPTKDIYRHPESLLMESSRSQPYMDIYSLGIILVELALWLPLRRIVKAVVDIRARTVTKAEILEAAKYVRGAIQGKGNGLDLQFRMGDIYSRAASLCVEIEPMGSEESLRLVEEAVNRLRSCVI